MKVLMPRVKERQTAGWSMRRWLPCSGRTPQGLCRSRSPGLVREQQAGQSSRPDGSSIIKGCGA